MNFKNMLYQPKQYIGHKNYENLTVTLATTVPKTAGEADLHAWFG